MRLIFLAIILLTPIISYCQTFHALIFSNMKESEQRAADRTEEMNNMKSFCQDIANSMGYLQDIRCHSDAEFTSLQFLSDLTSMEVRDDDIVIMYYNGHGCNWDDDDWPHMCFKDKQYWETIAFERLSETCGNAKLLLCIGCCCNMDSRGRKGYATEYAYNFDPNRVRKLFTGFSGKKRVIASSSIRGQYSYSWVSGSRLGSIYGISIREALNEVLAPTSKISPTWENVFDLAKNKTMNYTSCHKNGPQIPQYKIFDETITLSPRAKKILDEMRGSASANVNAVKANIQSTTLHENILIDSIISLVINVDFSVRNLSSEGCKIVAFLESPKGIGVNDINGRFCTTNGKVAVGKDYGTRQSSQEINNFELIIPMNELHILDKSNKYYIRVGFYDYKSNKYISWGQYTTLVIQ